MDGDTCNACVELLEKDTRIDPKIQVLWKDNAKYRALSDINIDPSTFNVIIPALLLCYITP